MIRRLVLPLLLLLAVACSTTDGSEDAKETPRERYSGEAGESPVGAVPDVTLRDGTRGKNLVLSIDYPTRPGPHPLIVFSHGFGGSNRGYTGLSSYWASQGYVVIRPTHADSGRLRDLASVDEIWESQTAADWANRAADIRFVIDSIDRLVQMFPELQGKIDSTRIGVGGHSYGAHTAMLIGGGKTFPGAVSYVDSRVKAIVAMSPQGPAADRGLTSDSFVSLRLPALFMTGSLDRGVSEAETPEWRRQAFTLASEGDKWFVSIEGARHASFSGRREDILERRAERTEMLPSRADQRNPSDSRRPRMEGAMARERQIFESVRLISLAFWDAYLRGDAAGRQVLEKGASRSGVTVEQR